MGDTLSISLVRHLAWTSGSKRVGGLSTWGRDTRGGYLREVCLAGPHYTGMLRSEHVQNTSVTVIFLAV